MGFEELFTNVEENLAKVLGELADIKLALSDSLEEQKKTNQYLSILIDNMSTSHSESEKNISDIDFSSLNGKNVAFSGYRLHEVEEHMRSAGLEPIKILSLDKDTTKSDFGVGIVGLKDGDYFLVNCGEAHLKAITDMIISAIRTGAICFSTGKGQNAMQYNLPLEHIHYFLVTESEHKMPQGITDAVDLVL